jgi:hypothetical protein
MTIIFDKIMVDAVALLETKGLAMVHGLIKEEVSQIGEMEGIGKVVILQVDSQQVHHLDQHFLLNHTLH